MKKILLALTTIVFLMASLPSNAQDDLLDILNEETKDEKEINYTYATFKATRIINGQSVEYTSPGELSFIIAHRFGKVNDGLYQLFGLDQATIRFGFEYGLSDKINIGFGRSSFQKTVDGYVKFRLLRQSTGYRNMPISVSYFGSVASIGLRDVFPDVASEPFSTKLAYTNQLLIARKFSNSFSLQLSPTLIHRNLVVYPDDPNDILALGLGTRYKLSSRVSLNLEYFYRFEMDKAFDPVSKNAIAIGFDIETGGHVFQFHLTNSKGMAERYFVADTRGDLFDGDVFFGFNINRVFTIKKK